MNGLQSPGSFRPSTGTTGRIRYGIRLLSFLVVFFVHLPATAAGPPEVLVLPIHGTVDPAMAAFVKRVIREAASVPNPRFVLEIDTFGGRVDSALEIVEALLEVPAGNSIAFVDKKAISAGALIALACGRLVMRPHTTIGDAAPITYSEEGPRMMGEKFQSPLRAKFRALARRNGYPPVLAEAMVTPEMRVFKVVFPEEVRYLEEDVFNNLPASEKERVRSRETVVEEGELLTMDDSEARELGFAAFSAAGIDEMLAELEFGEYRLSRRNPSWSEKFAGVIGTFAPLLLMLGLAALYIELKAPGFGVPGVVGLLALGLVFFNQYLVGLADYTELILIVLGVVLLGFELFVIPGFGLAGVAGFLCIGIGFVLAFQDFVIPAPDRPWQSEILVTNSTRVLGALLFAFLAGLLFLRYVFPRLGRVVEGPYLAATLKDYRSAAGKGPELPVGTGGRAVTHLRPAGKMKIGDEIYDVVSEGEFLEPETELVVVAVHGNRIVVAEKGTG